MEEVVGGGDLDVLLLVGLFDDGVEVLQVGDDEDDGVEGGEVLQDDELAEGDFVAVFDVVAALEGDFEGSFRFGAGIGAGAGAGVDVDVLEDEVRPQVGYFFGPGVAEFFVSEDFFDVVLEVDGEGFGFAVLTAAFDGFVDVDADAGPGRFFGWRGAGSEEAGNLAVEFRLNAEGDVAAEAEAEVFGPVVGAVALAGVE